MRVYLLEEGVLLEKSNSDYSSYNNVYDKLHGYYDEGQCYEESLEKAIAHAKYYVAMGVDGTYAVVSNATIDDDIDNIDELDVQDEEYIVDNVVYSIAKIDGEIVENFIKGV